MQAALRRQTGRRVTLLLPDASGVPRPGLPPRLRYVQDRVPPIANMDLAPPGEFSPLATPRGDLAAAIQQVVDAAPAAAGISAAHLWTAVAAATSRRPRAHPPPPQPSRTDFRASLEPTTLHELAPFHIHGEGIVHMAHGVDFGYTSPVLLRGYISNRRSATAHPDVVDALIAKDVAAGHMLDVTPILEAAPGLPITVAALGVVPKQGLDAAGRQRWRLICDSTCQPRPALGANAFCDTTLWEGTPLVSRVSEFGADLWDMRIHHPNEELVGRRSDIEAAYKAIPVAPQDFFLLAVRHRGRVYVCPHAPFGARTSGFALTSITNAISLKLRAQGHVAHCFVDDFIPVAARARHADLEAAVTSALAHHGLPVSLSKLEEEGPPSTTFRWVGFEFDTATMTARIPAPKLADLRAALTAFRARRRATRTELLSIIGKLRWAAQLIPILRPFLSRLQAAADSVHGARHWITLSTDAKYDMTLLASFMMRCNGVACIPGAPEGTRGHTTSLAALPHEWQTRLLPHADVDVFTDASLTGYGFVSPTLGVYGRGTWPAATNQPINTLEAAAASIAGQAVADAARRSGATRVRLHIDNVTAQYDITRLSCHSDARGRCLRALILTLAAYGLDVQAVRVASADNPADPLSRPLPVPQPIAACMKELDTASVHAPSLMLSDSGWRPAAERLRDEWATLPSHPSSLPTLASANRGTPMRAPATSASVPSSRGRPCAPARRRGKPPPSQLTSTTSTMFASSTMA
jgi:hypothetical protein